MFKNLLPHAGSLWGPVSAMLPSNRNGRIRFQISINLQKRDQALFLIKHILKGMLGLCLSFIVHHLYQIRLCSTWPGQQEIIPGKGRKIALEDLNNNISVLGFYQDEYYLLEFIRRRQNYFTSHKCLTGHSRLPVDSYPFHSLRTFATFLNF